MENNESGLASGQRQQLEEPVTSQLQTETAGVEDGSSASESVKTGVQMASLTSENVQKLSGNGEQPEDNEEREVDGDASSDVSRFSDLSHESWQPVRGPMAWVHEQMRKGESPQKILEQLVPKGTQIPDGLDPIMLWKIIINIASEPPSREKIKDINTLDDVLHLLRISKRIIVLTGAGVSVSCGIPDFRSRDGVYARLAKDFPNLPDPQAMFDIHFFRSDPRPFFKFAKEIYPGQFKPSLCHQFIRLLETKSKLLRNYTQNIDTLEQEAGIENVIQCHGSFATATCAVCGHKVNSSVIKEDIFKQVIPQCPNCPTTNEEAVMKPDIVFFGESLPEHFHNQMTEDKDDCDLLIVIGSSLKVRPVALIPNSLPANVPQILINRERLPYLNFDVELLGDCDRIVGELCRRLGSGWSHLAAEAPLLDQVLLSDLPTPPASPDHGQEKSSGEGQVSSSSVTTSAAVQDDALAGPSMSSASSSSKKHHKHQHHHHKHHHNHPKDSPLETTSMEAIERAEEGVSSSSGVNGESQNVTSETMDRLVDAGHKQDVMYESGKQSSTRHHNHHHHHHHSSHTPGSSCSQSHKSQQAQNYNHEPPLQFEEPSQSGSGSHLHRTAPEADPRPDRKRSNSDMADSSEGNKEKGKVTVVKRPKLGGGDSHPEGSVAGPSFSHHSSLGDDVGKCIFHSEEFGLNEQDNFDGEAGCDDDDDMEALNLWANRPRVSIAERLASNQMLFIPPSRYVFKGAEVFSDDSDSEDEESCNEDGDDEDALVQESGSPNHSHTEPQTAAIVGSDALTVSDSKETCDALRHNGEQHREVVHVEEKVAGASHELPTSLAVEGELVAADGHLSGEQAQQEKADCPVSSTGDVLHM